MLVKELKIGYFSFLLFINYQTFRSSHSLRYICFRVYYFKFLIICQARYFVADNVLDEVTFGWPRQKGDLQMKENLARNLQRAINWVLVLFSA